MDVGSTRPEGAAMSDRDAAKPTAPYVAWGTFLSLLARMEQKGIPDIVSSESVVSTVTSTYATQIVATLRFLGMLDSAGRSTALLRQLVSAGEQRAQVLAQAMGVAYRPVLERLGELANVTPGQLDGAFRETYRLRGETRRRATVFFTRAAEYAGMPISPALSVRPFVTVGDVGSSSRFRAGRQHRNEYQDPLPGVDVPEALETNAPAMMRRSVRFAAGGTLMARFEGDPFDLEEDERQLLFAINDQLRAFERRRLTGEPRTEEEQSRRGETP